MSRSPGPCPHCLFTCVCTAPGETDYRTEDLSPCSLWCPPPPHCCPRQAAGGAEGRWQQVRWPHLPVVRRGHVPLAYPVAVVGVGVVCISKKGLDYSLFPWFVLAIELLFCTRYLSSTECRLETAVLVKNYPLLHLYFSPDGETEIKK